MVAGVLRSGAPSATSRSSSDSLTSAVVAAASNRPASVPRQGELVMSHKLESREQAPPHGGQKRQLELGPAKQSGNIPDCQLSPSANRASLASRSSSCRCRLAGRTKHHIKSCSITQWFGVNKKGFSRFGRPEAERRGYCCGAVGMLSPCRERSSGGNARHLVKFDLET